MGEKQSRPFRLFFNASLKVDFQGFRVTTDSGLIWVREMAEGNLTLRLFGATPRRIEALLMLTG